MAAAFKRWMRSLLDWVIREAKRDGDITHDQYRGLVKRADELRKRIDKA